jgi:hypothetical protein
MRAPRRRPDPAVPLAARHTLQAGPAPAAPAQTAHPRPTIAQYHAHSMRARDKERRRERDSHAYTHSRHGPCESQTDDGKAAACVRTGMPRSRHSASYLARYAAALARCSTSRRPRSFTRCCHAAICRLVAGLSRPTRPPTHKHTHKQAKIQTHTLPKGHSEVLALRGRIHTSWALVSVHGVLHELLQSVCALAQRHAVPLVRAQQRRPRTQAW